MAHPITLATVPTSMVSSCKELLIIILILVVSGAAHQPLGCLFHITVGTCKLALRSIVDVFRGLGSVEGRFGGAMLRGLRRCLRRDGLPSVFQEGLQQDEGGVGDNESRAAQTPLLAQRWQGDLEGEASMNSRRTCWEGLHTRFPTPSLFLEV